MADPARNEKPSETPERVPEARADERGVDLQGEGAGQTSSPATSGGASVGTFEPAYEGGDPFLGEGAHVVSGEARGPRIEDDAHDAPGLVLDRGRDPHPDKDVGVVRSNEPGAAGRGSDDLRTYEDQGPDGTR